jgi:hypothetical protein
MTARGERAARRSRTPVAGTQARRTARTKTTPRARTRLRLDTGDDVDVSSSVTIAAANDDDSDGDDHGSPGHQGTAGSAGRVDAQEDEGNASHVGGQEEDDDDRQEDQQRETNLPAAAAPGNQAGEDDNFESMGWWSALTPGQQRSMMRRFLVQPSTPTAQQQPIVIQAPASETPRRPRVKSLKIDDFRGQPSEAVEAWLATIPQEVERQASLGGETWTAEELFYGATAHLKDAAGKWLITLRETMRPEDKNLNFLIRAMRKKYGRRDTMFNIQQRLAARVQQPGERLSDYAASLTNIGFGKRVPADYCVQAFINGINSTMTATQVRTFEPQTLDEAVQFAEDKCGEFGEGFKVTDWRVAKRRYREDRGIDEEDQAQPTRRKTHTDDAEGPIDWKKLGLDFGGEEPPSFDMDGKPVDGLAKTAKRDPVSLAALQAMIYFSGLQDAKLAAASSKPRTARTLEVKSENN